MSGGVDPAASARSVEGLRHADLASGELESSLRAVADATAKIFAADGGGIMLIDDQQSLHYVGATSGRAAALEAAQEETGEGPCVDSLVGGIPVQTQDLLADDRWPVLTSQVGELGIRAILGVPLFVDRSSVGSLNVYRFEPGEWTESDVQALEAHATIIEEILNQAMLAGRHHTIVEQLSTALNNRVQIDRATGIVMGVRDVDAVAAFHELRLMARSRRVKIVELADEVVRSRAFPPDDG